MQSASSVNLRRARATTELYLGSHSGALVTIEGRGRLYEWVVSRNARTLRGCGWPLDVAQDAALAAAQLMDHLDEVAVALDDLNELADADTAIDLDSIEVKPLSWLGDFKLYHLRNFPYGSEGRSGWVWDGNQWLSLPCPLENRINGNLLYREEPITVADALRGVGGRFGLLYSWRGWPLSQELNGETFWLFPL